MNLLKTYKFSNFKIVKGKGCYLYTSNKKKLLDLHPKLSSMLMVFKVGYQKGLGKDQCEFLSEAFYKYFFCLKNIKNISFDTTKPNLEGASLCLVLVVFFESAIKQYCEAESDVDSYEDSRSRYIEYIKAGFEKAKINIDLDKAWGLPEMMIF